MGRRGSGASCGGGSRKTRPWFDAKAAFVFPLGEGAVPKTRQEFVESLTLGWKSQIRFPESVEIVQAKGGRYPAIGSLRMQLGGGVSRSDEDDKNPVLRPNGKVDARLAVRDFDLDARPLLVETSKLNIHMTATDARLDIQHDDHGHSMVMLADAASATFELQATNSDMERMLTQDLNEAAHRYGISVKKAKLKLTVTDNRAIDLDLHVSTRVTIVPAGFHFHAHVDIDDKMNARLSKLKADGDEALGPLIVGLIRPGLAKYEGKSRPVFGFPTGQLKLRDVKIQGGEEIKISAAFAR